MTLNPAKDPSCVLAFDWGEGAGNVVYDLSGNGNHGTIYGATRTRGILRYAGSFDGKDDYINVGKGLNSITQYTALAWVKIFDYPLTYAYGIMTLGGGFNTHGFRFKVTSTKKLWLLMADNGTYSIYISDVDIPLKKWTLVGVVGVPGSYVQLIVDETIKTISTAQRMSQPRGDTLIGSSWTATGELFKGLIGSLRIYNRALSEKEIREHYYYGISMLKQKIPSKFVPSPLRV